MCLSRRCLTLLRWTLSMSRQLQSCSPCNSLRRRSLLRPSSLLPRPLSLPVSSSLNQRWSNARSSVNCSMWRQFDSTHSIQWYLLHQLSAWNSWREVYSSRRSSALLHLISSVFHPLLFYWPCSYRGQRSPPRPSSSLLRLLSLPVSSSLLR